jgi:uncharacterized membrane protein (DUF485 family)
VSQPLASSEQHRGPTVPVTSLQASNNADSANISAPARGTAPTPDDFVRVQAEPDFQDLRHRVRRFVFPMTAFFLTWYLAYMLLATYAHAFMATKVFSNINVGVLLGFGQFVTTFAITIVYVRFAGRTLDPRAAKIRSELEGAGQ